jgi:predicted nicotinamide N-methyase
MSNTHRRANFPDAVWAILSQRVRECVVVGGREFALERPANPDLLVNHAAVRKALAVDDYLPYWADLWPGARMLAEAILRERWEPATSALEIGCGLGLPGIVAMSAGLRVTLSDYDELALHLAADNARLNGFADPLTVRLDWRDPPSEQPWQVLLAADVVYESRSARPVVELIKALLPRGGLCLMADQIRASSAELQRQLAQAGWTIHAQTVRAPGSDGRLVKGTLYRIQG